MSSSSSSSSSSHFSDTEDLESPHIYVFRTTTSASKHFVTFDITTYCPLHTFVHIYVGSADWGYAVLPVCTPNSVPFLIYRNECFKTPDDNVCFSAIPATLGPNALYSPRLDKQFAHILAYSYRVTEDWEAAALHRIHLAQRIRNYGTKVGALAETLTFEDHAILDIPTQDSVMRDAVGSLVLSVALCVMSDNKMLWIEIENAIWSYRCNHALLIHVARSIKNNTDIPESEIGTFLKYRLDGWEYNKESLTPASRELISGYNNEEVCTKLLRHAQADRNSDHSVKWETVQENTSYCTNAENMRKIDKGKSTGQIIYRAYVLEHYVLRKLSYREFLAGGNPCSVSRDLYFTKCTTLRNWRTTYRAMPCDAIRKMGCGECEVGTRECQGQSKRDAVLGAKKWDHALFIDW